MPLPKVIPALADLTQDIAGQVPVDLLHGWASGAQAMDAAQTLPDSFQVEGTVVCTDTSSTRLDARLAGAASGYGWRITPGVIYPAHADPRAVVEAMGEAQFRIGERLRVRIGMCVHSGRFHEIGGGLYGGDADEVEYLAETCAGPGEILLTEGVLERLKFAAGNLIPKVFQEDN